MQIKDFVQDKVCKASTNKHEENSALWNKKSNKTKVTKKKIKEKKNEK